MSQFLLMLAFGAALAFLIGLAAAAAHLRPRPRRRGFEVRHDR